MELDNIEAVVRMVEAGLGASLVPASIVTDAAHRRLLVSRPLDPPLYRQIGMILRADKPDTPALAHVRAALLTLRDRPVRDLS
jgi:DNA-binding transcriptional LysR family regulator